MNLTIQIPDELARELAATGGDLSRRALEAFALEEFRRGNLTKAELSQLLGCETQTAIDGFLKAHGVLEEKTPDHLEREPAAGQVLERESGIWVLRTGQPIDPAAIDRTLTAIRDERDAANLGPLP